MLTGLFRKTGIVFIGVAILTLIASVVGANSFVVPSLAGRLSLNQEVKHLLTREMDQYQIPGGVVGIWVPGRAPCIVTAGVSDVATARPVEADMKFRVASVSKTFTTTCLLQLVCAGKVSLDDAVADYFPAISHSSEITVRQLCDHTSGLEDYSVLPQSYALRGYSPATVTTPEQLVAMSAAMPLRFEPGKAFEYSNTNTILVGMIVEKLTGESLEEVIRTSIVEPLGLSETYLSMSPWFPDGTYSNGYDADRDSGRIFQVVPINPSLAWGTAGMVSNLEDLKIWAEALGSGCLLSEAVQAERLRAVREGSGSGYGLGVESKSGFVGHEGCGLGYSCGIYNMPASGITIVVLLNSSASATPVGEIFDGITRALLGGQTAAGM